MSTIRTRELQMFPALSSEQIGIARRFSSGSQTRLAPEEIIYKVGDRHAPAWLVLAGSMKVVRSDGLYREALITTHTAGQFAGEVNPVPRDVRIG